MPRIDRIAGLLGALCCAGCASTQSVEIRCVPHEVQVYVDGRLLEGSETSLSTDQPHKIYAKAPGYQPRLVVLEPQVDEHGRAGFAEDDLCVELVPIGMDRKLDVEVEPGGADEPPAR